MILMPQKNYYANYYQAGPFEKAGDPASSMPQPIKCNDFFRKKKKKKIG
jgi:hypothetical protein